MANDKAATGHSDLQVRASDIQFECTHCANILIVDREGVGMKLACPHCGDEIEVPAKSDVLDPSKNHGAKKQSKANPALQTTFDFADKSAADLDEHIQKLQRKLKENASQRTEIQGYINQETIKLHRRKLQLEKLLDKQGALDAEIAAAKAARN